MSYNVSIGTLNPTVPIPILVQLSVFLRLLHLFLNYDQFVFSVLELVSLSADSQYCLQRLAMLIGCKSHHRGLRDVSHC